MLVILAEYLSEWNPGFQVFRYITLRTILAVLTGSETPAEENPTGVA